MSALSIGYSGYVDGIILEGDISTRSGTNDYLY